MKFSIFNPPRADQFSKFEVADFSPRLERDLKVATPLFSEVAAFRLRLRDVNVATPVNSSGQSLVEIIVAVGLIMVTMVALLSLSVVSMKSSGYGVSKAKATKLANEEMELVRAYRDSMEWSDFATDHTLGPGVVGCGTDCLPGTVSCYIDSSLNRVWGCDDAGVETVDQFKRYFWVGSATAGLDSYTITVFVTWTDQSGEHEVEVYSILADWK